MTITLHGRVYDLRYLTLDTLDSIRELITGYGHICDEDLTATGRIDFKLEITEEDAQSATLDPIAEALVPKDDVSFSRQLLHATEQWYDLAREVESHDAHVVLRGATRS